MISVGFTKRPVIPLLDFFFDDRLRLYLLMTIQLIGRSHGSCGLGAVKFDRTKRRFCLDGKTSVIGVAVYGQLRMASRPP
jgi:hypothetical protein